MAWPRWSVRSTVSSTRLSSAWANSAKPDADVEVAFGLTISTARTRPQPSGAHAISRRGACRSADTTAWAAYAPLGCREHLCGDPGTPCCIRHPQ